MKHKQITKLILWSSLYALSLTMFITFIAAFLSPTKSVIVHINQYGEADVELILFSMIIGLATMYAIYNIRKK